MKTLSFMGFILSIVGILVSLYAFTTVVPAELSLRDAEDRSYWAEAHSLKNLFALIILGIGSLGLIFSIIPYFKTKTKIALAGMLLSIIVFVYWLAAFTHMFS